MAIPECANCIGLALQEHADWLLTGDAQAHQFAESAGLEVYGPIGILLWNVANENLLDKVLAFQLLEDPASSS